MYNGTLISPVAALKVRLYKSHLQTLRGPRSGLPCLKSYALKLCGLTRVAGGGYGALAKFADALTAVVPEAVSLLPGLHGLTMEDLTKDYRIVADRSGVDRVRGKATLWTHHRATPRAPRAHRPSWVPHTRYLVNLVWPKERICAGFEEGIFYEKTSPRSKRCRLPARLQSLPGERIAIGGYRERVCVLSKSLKAVVAASGDRRKASLICGVNSGFRGSFVETTLFRAQRANTA